ncbi:hypothetical protein [Pediococcus pentosaceus]
MVNTILKEADLFCPNSVRINFTIYPITDITQIDIEFWQMLLEKNIVISNDGEWYFISQKVQWYNSLSEKLAKKIKVG